MVMRSTYANTALWALSALSVVTQVFAQAPVPNRQVDPAVFPGITPSEKLEWHDCYDVFKCARLSVPAKVSGKRCKDRVEIAIIRLPYRRTNESMPAQQQGTVHIQLGGWSASSTNFLVRFGESYTTLLAGYELLAIDYRGYGWSTPSINCFASEAERQAFALPEPPLLSSSLGITEVWEARARNFSRSCRKHAARAISYGGSYAAAVDHVTVMKAMSQEKLSFWAVTSGSVVASTVAFLYPQYIDKLLLDAPEAVAPDYTTTTAQAKNVEDSNTALSAFLYTCLHADPHGPSPCNFTGSSTTLADIRARFNKIEADLLAKGDAGLSVPNFPPEVRFTWSRFKVTKWSELVCQTVQAPPTRVFCNIAKSTAMTTQQRAPRPRPREDPQAYHPPYRSWEQLKQDNVWVRYNSGYTDRLIWYLNGAFPACVSVSSAPYREDNLAPLFTPASEDHQSDSGGGGTWHEIAKLPMTKPPVSSINVSCLDLEELERSWVRTHKELCDEDEGEYASSQDFSSNNNDDDDERRRPIATASERNGRREADQGTRYLMRCCGQDRPFGKTGQKVTVASSSANEFVTIGDYVTSEFLKSEFLPNVCLMSNILNPGVLF
ncbi:uncharacterized protein B0I36DRAFT_351072 [Microdochium trichocladiopsis]|uniref:AB hydrolase-1 domain-containing protein n=1 Tax=Microdochium trichocladiopsis TaxID=1682393 RepID=A0A9P8Y1N8_9PEZI|nr:uncharacterized protein B0I36DRAFT_351072 [Microdochium trichocladiopsis]KAH7027555.1 hypothetical protein B0I36DRAFT_351072 [Microdochium trichocladiopsis]